MNTLAIDCSGQVIGASLALSDGTLITKRLDQIYGQAEALAPLVSSVIHESGLSSLSDLDQLVVCRGPGGFTGLRVAISFAKGLEAALPSLSLLAISSDQYWLARWEQGLSCQLKGEPFVAIDTRRKDFYGKWLCNGVDASWQIYETGEQLKRYSTEPIVGLGNASEQLNLATGQTVCEEIDCAWLSEQSLRLKFVERYCSQDMSPLYARAPAISL